MSIATGQTNQEPIKKKLPKKIIFAGLLGNVLEWFDYMLYALFAAPIAHNFFKSDDPLVSLMMTFGVFGVGFVARPFGALVFGHLGDKCGRKIAMALSIILMGLGTFCIGVLPSISQIGLWAPLLLVACRLLQGLSAGGEFGSATTYLAEFATVKNRAFISSLGISAINSGVLLGSVVGLAISSNMPQAAFYSWGWRVPFIASILIAVTGLYMRRSMEETAAFSKVVEQGEVPKNPILEVFRTQRGSVLKIFFSLAGINVLTWVCIPFTTTLLVSILKYPPALGFSVAVMQTILVIIAAPLFGRLADKINRKKMVLCNLALLVILAYPLYSIITTTKSLGMLYLVVGILGMAVPSITAAFYPYYVELFPANVRASGLSIAYNLGQMVFGGTALYIVTYLTKLNGVMSVPIYLMGMLAVTFITILFFFPQQLRKEL